MPIILNQSYPPLQPSDIPKMEDSLGTKLPDDYKDFLLSSNGGLVPDNISYSFTIPIQQIHSNWTRENLTDCLEDMFGFEHLSSRENQEGPSSLLQENEDYRQEDFLPRHVIAIGRTPTDSLLCISTNTHDFGCIYYWYYYWNYPWAKTQFTTKIQEVQTSFPQYEAIIKEQQSREFQQLSDLLNYATLTCLASSFHEFVGLLDTSSEKA